LPANEQTKWERGKVGQNLASLRKNRTIYRKGLAYSTAHFYSGMAGRWGEPSRKWTAAFPNSLTAAVSRTKTELFVIGNYSG
jgi:hypothetical protein